MRLTGSYLFSALSVFCLTVFLIGRPAVASATPVRSDSVQSAPAQALALSQRPESEATPQRIGRISLDVVVTNKAGAPVSGLDVKDFTVLDDGRPAKVLSFQEVNKLTQKAGPPAEVILLIDTVNVGFTPVARAREEIQTFLRQNGGHLAYPVTVFAFANDGVKILVQPSADGNAEASQLEQADNGLRTITRSAGAYGAIERFQLSIQWLQVVANNMAKRPGRKLLIWVGPGWPMLDRQNIETSSKGAEQLFKSIVDFSTTLREGHIELSSVSLGEPGPGTFLYQDFLKGVKTADKANPPNLGVKVIAAQSGGRVMAPDNGLAGQIDKCVEDGADFYMISFDPPAADKPNEYHDLKVQVDKAGLAARTNTGYYNQP